MPRSRASGMSSGGRTPRHRRRGSDHSTCAVTYSLLCFGLAFTHHADRVPEGLGDVFFGPPPGTDDLAVGADDRDGVTGRLESLRPAHLVHREQIGSLARCPAAPSVEEGLAVAWRLGRESDD